MEKNSNRVFIDSNFFIALYNPQDTQNFKAIQYSEEIKEQQYSPVISNFIFLEATTVITQRIGKVFAIRAGQRLLEKEVFEYIHINQSLQKRSWEIFQDVEKKNISFIDCSILSCMEMEGIHTLLTFDQKDFSSLRKKYRFNFL